MLQNLSSAAVVIGALRVNYKANQYWIQRRKYVQVRCSVIYIEILHVARFANTLSKTLIRLLWSQMLQLFACNKFLFPRDEAQIVFNILLSILGIFSFIINL